MRRIAAIGALAALAAALFVSSPVVACESKTCHADFDCDSHQICMHGRGGIATCEWPGANPVMPVARLLEAKSCSNDSECQEGWRCEKQVSGDDVKASSSVCMPGERQRIAY